MPDPHDAYIYAASVALPRPDDETDNTDPGDGVLGYVWLYKNTGPKGTTLQVDWERRAGWTYMVTDTTGTLGPCALIGPELAPPPPLVGRAVEQLITAVAAGPRAELAEPVLSTSARWEHAADMESAIVAWLDEHDAA